MLILKEDAVANVRKLIEIPIEYRIKAISAIRATKAVAQIIQTKEDKEEK